MFYRIVIISLLIITVAHAANQIVMMDIDATLHEYDADITAFAELIDLLLLQMDVDNVMIGATIQQTRYDDIEYTVIYGQDDGSGLKQIYFTGSNYDYCLLLSAIASCGITSASTEWHSDELRICFENIWYLYTTQECRDIYEMIGVNTNSYIIEDGGKLSDSGGPSEPLRSFPESHFVIRRVEIHASLPITCDAFGV